MLKIRKIRKPFVAAHVPRQRDLDLLARKRLMLHVKTGDLVRILAGKDRGHEGRVLRVNRKAQRAVVEGANIVQKHQKPGPKNQKGGIVKVEAPIHVSNLKVLESASG